MTYHHCVCQRGSAAVPLVVFVNELCSLPSHSHVQMHVNNMWHMEATATPLLAIQSHCRVQAWSCRHDVPHPCMEERSGVTVSGQRYKLEAQRREP